MAGTKNNKLKMSGKDSPESKRLETITDLV